MKDVIEVQPLDGYRLHLRFDDGVLGEVNLNDFLVFDGVFAAIRDPATFAQVRVDPQLGTICWPNGADLDPDVLYERVQRQRG